jgi:hypothetical protein
MAIRLGMASGAVIGNYEQQTRLVHVPVVLIHHCDRRLLGRVHPPEAVGDQGAPGPPPRITIFLAME